MSDDPGFDTFTQLRPLLFSIAYRMLGRVSDAEDVVQEAFLRYQRATSSGTRVESPKAFLSAVTTRLCIDHARSAASRHESYVGAWLPEPVLSDGGRLDPAERVELADTLSMAFLLLLERLSPVERAVFLLHDVFSYDYDEIAEIVGKTPDNCRQLAVRARRHVAAGKPRFEPSRTQRDALADRFFAALGTGEIDGLVEMLTEDVVVHGDSGGTRPNWPRPIAGRARVLRLLGGLSEDMRRLDVRVQRTEVNGQPGAVFTDAGGRIINVMVLDIADGAVQAVRSVINPEKLRHLGPLADVGDLVRRRNDLRRSPA